MTTHHDEVIKTLFEKYDELSLKTYKANAFQSGIAEAKADGTAVTIVDKKSSDMVLEALKAHTPDYGIMCEEEPIPLNPGADWQWVVDPLDGTACFSRGFPVWGMGIGLLHQGRPVQGYLRFPVLDETYCFNEDGFTFNGEAIPLPTKDATFSGAEPLRDTQNYLVDSSLNRIMASLKPFRTIKTRAYGSTLYHVVSLAMGRAEVMLCGRVYLWDLAAGLAMSRALGHVERYVDGTPFSLDDLTPQNSYRLAKPLIIGPPSRLDDLIPQFELLL